MNFALIVQWSLSVVKRKRIARQRHSRSDESGASRSKRWQRRQSSWVALARSRATTPTTRRAKSAKPSDRSNLSQVALARSWRVSGPSPTPASASSS